METFNTFRKIGKYEISNTCLQTYPCKHMIKFQNGTSKLLCGGEIYRLFKSEGLNDSHIDKYSEFVRQQDFPTLEEIKKRISDKIRIKAESEKRKKEEAAYESIYIKMPPDPLF